MLQDDSLVVSAMVTPALFILASASLLATVLVRMARVVDSVRDLARHSGPHAGASADIVRRWLERHKHRAAYALRAIATLYAAVVAFVASCLCLALDRIGITLPGGWAAALAIVGAVLLMVGCGWMLAETRLAGLQLDEEIARATLGLEEMTDVVYPDRPRS